MSKTPVADVDAGRHGVRIYILDDQVLFRQTLAEVIASRPGLDVVGQAGEGNHALREIAQLEPDLVMVDVGLPTIDGIEVCKRLRATQPWIRLVLVTAYPGPDLFRRAVESGIDAFLLKDATIDDVVDTIRITARGTSMFNSALVRQYVGGVTANAPGLTRRELQVLRSMTVGRSNREIAADLGIHEKTVRNHLSNIYDKLDVRGRAQAVVYAIQNGLGSEVPSRPGQYLPIGNGARR
ncbi:MAG: response regulator transcription factor [Candidatus Dormibacteraeota bacterium]|nr:response regulator transcription factor [Candidatus Dormibacteraeota bacterium]